MKYVERVLQPGETIIYLTSVHWFVYLQAAILFVVALAFFVASGAVADDTASLACEAAAGIVLLLSALAAVDAFIRRATTELAITDRRVIFKTGLFRRQSTEINRSKVETVGVDQSIVGRLLDYGTVVVRGTGGSLEPIACVGAPLTFRSHITAG